MAKFKDFQLEEGDYQAAREYSDADALALAVRNILLSRPGNFPFNPSIGVNIKKYQFNLIDTQELKTIQREIDRAISACIPNIDTTTTVVKKIIGDDNHPYIAISVNASVNGNESSVNFVLDQIDNDVRVFNEIY